MLLRVVVLVELEVGEWTEGGHNTKLFTIQTERLCFLLPALPPVAQADTYYDDGTVYK